SGEDVLATRDDHVIAPALDEQAPVLIEVTDVAGCHQSVQHVLTAAAGIALKKQFVADEDPPPLARPNLAVLVIEQLDDRPARRLAGGPRRTTKILGRRDRRPC